MRFICTVSSTCALSLLFWLRSYLMFHTLKQSMRREVKNRDSKINQRKLTDKKEFVRKCFLEVKIKAGTITTFLQDIIYFRDCQISACDTSLQSDT